MAFWDWMKKKHIISNSPMSPPKQKPIEAPVEKCIQKPKENVLKRTPETRKIEQKHIDPRKAFLEVFKKLTYCHRAWDVWRDFIIMFACSLSNSADKAHYDEREKRYLKIIKKYSKTEQALFPELAAHTVMALEKNPEQDFLGDIFMNLNLGNGANGQFFTPYHVCDLMAKVAMGEDVAQQVKENGYITINDPCCGAGATLIAGVHEARRQLEKVGLNFQNHVLVVAQDIDEIVALMCYIQLSLLGVAAYIKVGNSLTEPMTTDDDRKNYWFTLMYFSDVWAMRRVFHKMDKLMKGDK
ncbi:MAG: SAM-dependent DNA methyltransferase [Erysipelotrichaceae bacterium]|nr:SAM-dependent DNA methyltransferase [Erysipelotrichaceae bacterium]